MEKVGLPRLSRFHSERPLVDVLSIPDGKRMNPAFVRIEIVDHAMIPHAQFVCVHALQLLMGKSVEPSRKIVQRVFDRPLNVRRKIEKPSNLREQTIVARIFDQAPG